MTKRSPSSAPAAIRATLSTPERILLAAEQLFSERGVDGVSLREITSTSGVNSAAAHYHFGSKLAVLERLFELRAKPIAQQRMALLSALRTNRQGRPALEDVLRAFLQPALQALSTPEGIAFTRLRARLSFENEEVRRHVLDKTFNESSRLTLEALRKALPQLPADELNWRFHFLLGSMVYTMALPGRIESLTDEKLDTRNWQVALDQLVAYAAAGFRAAP
ncbi:MAG: TetR/AcrR family transcriptional regulator [Burkholderiaceae bacterium]